MSGQLTTTDVSLLRHAMGAVGGPAFFPALKGFVEARVPFGTFLMFRFDPNQPPRLLDHWIAEGKLRPTALVEYTENTYAFDPFHQFRQVPEEGRLLRLSEIAPDRFFSSEYYLQYYRSAGLCDEVGLLKPLGGGSVAHLSLSRLDEQGPFRGSEIRHLRHFSPLLLELLLQHCASQPAAPPPEPAAERPPLADLIRSHGREVLGIRLTRREAQIAGLVLQGHSNGSAALTLDIARETGKVHRRNLYRKLAISSQRELFGLFKHLL